MLVLSRLAEIRNLVVAPWKSTSYQHSSFPINSIINFIVDYLAFPLVLIIVIIASVMMIMMNKYYHTIIYKKEINKDYFIILHYYSQAAQTGHNAVIMQESDIQDDWSLLLARNTEMIKIYFNTCESVVNLLVYS